MRMLTPQWTRPSALGLIIRQFSSKFVVGVVLSLIAIGCQQPKVFRTISGGKEIYPDVLSDRPTILAFLSANDRRCDKEIPSLWALTKRPMTPVQILGVLVYDDFSFVDEIATRGHVSFVILLDPDRDLAEKFRIPHYPTYVYLDWKGDEIDRQDDIRLVPKWMDSDRWLKKAMPVEKEEQRPAVEEETAGIWPSPAK